jgi:hypothetical protein
MYSKKQPQPETIPYKSNEGNAQKMQGKGRGNLSQTQLGEEATSTQAVLPTLGPLGYGGTGFRFGFHIERHTATMFCTPHHS